MHLWIAAWSPCWWGSCGGWPSGCSSCSSRQAGGCRWADPDVQVSGWRGQWCLVCLWRRWWRRSSCWTYHPSRSGSGWWHGQLLHHHLPRCRHEPWLWSPAHRRRERMGLLDEPGNITDTQSGLKYSAEVNYFEWTWLQSVKSVVSRRPFTTFLPCQRSLWHWPQTLQTTWWAAQVLWWRWNLPGTHWRWLWPAESYHNQGDHRTAHPWMGSCQTWGTCLDVPLGTEFKKIWEKKGWGGKAQLEKKKHFMACTIPL